VEKGTIRAGEDSPCMTLHANIRELKKELKKAILGIILVLLIAMMPMTQFVKSVDTVSTTKSPQILSDAQVQPVVFLFVGEVLALGKEKSMDVLDFLKNVKADVAYRVLNTYGESVEAMINRWNGLNAEWFIQECHKINIKVMPVVSTQILEPEYFNSSFIESAATRNVTDQLILQYQANVGNYYYHGSLNHIVWRDHLFQVAKVAVDLGIDGIEFDEPTYWWWTGEDYSDECLQQFKDYLQTKYTQDELRNKFGINDITTFNYREYLASKGLIDVSEQERLQGSDPLGREYYIFELVSLSQHFKELTTRIKDYAKQKYGKDLIIVVNQYEMKNADLINCPQVDFFSIGSGLNVLYWSSDQQSGIKNGPPYYTASPFILLARAVNSTKQAVIFIDEDYIHAKLTPTVAKIVMSEAYAFGGYYNLPYYSGTVGSAAVYGPNETISEFASFIRRYSDFFKPSINPSDVALFTPYSDLLWHAVPSFSDPIYGASQILSDAHIPFNMLFTGDGNVFPDTLTVEDLKKYKLIYLPHICGLSDRQVNILKDYLNQGGKLLITGGCGLFDEMRNMRPSGPFDSLHSNPNVMYIQWESDVWEDWIPYSDYKATRNPDMRNQIFNAIKNLLGGNLILETNASSTVGINTSFQPENNRLLVNFVNYDYHIENDTVTEQDNIHVKLKEPAGFNASTAESVYFSPDVGLEPMPLKYSISGDYIEFTLPRLQTYSIVLVGSIHDVSTTDVEPYRTIVGRNSNTSVNVTVANEGYAPETFNVALYANTSLIQTRQVNLPIGESASVTFNWNFTLPLGNYSIRAAADAVNNETVLSNNDFSYGTIQVSIPGDITADGVVNILDVSKAARAFGLKVGDERWDSNADVNEDGSINILDLSLIAKEYGKRA
jgi:hypothetical protein